MNSYATPTYLSGSCYIYHSLPHIPRQDAELQWERSRRELRASLADLPSSSFARTMLEEDDLFYATFPDARRAAIDLWASENLLHGPYVARVPQAAHVATLESPTAALPQAHGALPPANHASAQDIPHLYHLEACPPSVQLNYKYGTVGRQPNCPAVSSINQGQTPNVQRFKNHQSVLKPSPPPSPEIIRIAPHLLVPSQRRSGIQPLPTVSPLKVVGRPLFQSFSNTADTPPYTLSSACPTHSFPVVSSPASSSSFVPLQFTGDWEVDAIAAEKSLSASKPLHPVDPVVPSMTPQDIPPPDLHSPRHGPSHRKNRTTCLRSHPYSSRSRTSRSPSASRASPSRTRKAAKQVRNKDGKPSMACLFCRGRKIACGPPLPGSNSTTCDQCERRHLKCKYPAENRRGMRRKKVDSDDAINAKKKNDGDNAGEAEKEDGDGTSDTKTDDRDDALDANTNPKKQALRSGTGTKAHFVKSELSELEDVAMSDVADDDSGSEWDGND